MAGGQNLRFIKLKAGGNTIMVLPASSFIKFFEYGQEVVKEVAALPEADRIEANMGEEYLRGFNEAMIFMKNSFTEQLNKSLVDMEIAEITPGSVEKINPDSI
jgi:hypothetical protein